MGGFLRVGGWFRPLDPREWGVPWVSSMSQGVGCPANLEGFLAGFRWFWVGEWWADPCLRVSDCF